MTAVAIYVIQHEYTISPRDYRYHTGMKCFQNCNHSEGKLTVMLPLEQPLIPPKNPYIGLIPTCTL